MATLQDMANAVRERLNDPLPQSASLRHTFRAVADSAQARVNQSSASGKAWSIQECLLNVTSNTSDYVLPVDTSFGKPLSVLTVYNQSQSYIPRYIDFSEINDLYYDWGLPANVASYVFNYDGSPNTAARIAFYRKPDDPSVWVRVLPTPQLAATYLICYSQGTWAQDAAIDSSPLLAQFHPLIEMDAVELLLAHAAWFDESTKEGREANSNRRKEIATAQSSMKQKYEDDFDRFIRSTNDPGITIRKGSFDMGAWG
jgi:hypothetical protein